MNDDQKYALTLMHAALTDFLSYNGDPNMSMESLLERAAQAALVAEAAFPELKEIRDDTHMVMLIEPNGVDGVTVTRKFASNFCQANKEWSWRELSI